ncbi:hypothetical protein [Hymenobacter siberiensis]|uniref:hypothetical protein n=1 Tax=Hymenobacter siberiensis TaxID=2848396 RepID=UPI001C1DFF6D|nr:hypothetical protein [Hymenobacter siberiensis]
MFIRLLLLCSLLVLLVVGPACAQDLLTKRNGDEVAVKVVEITPSEVKYRRADNPDGPLISVWRSDVFLIRYANGTKEVLNAPPATASGGVPVSTAAAHTAFPADVPTVNNQSPDDAILDEPIRLDGPRIGFTILSANVLDKARESIPDLNPFLTQFGWQFESRLFRLPNGVSGLVEFVPLVGGLEQGKFLPSVSGLLGMRGAKGFEFGVGPNLTPLGANLVLAMGTSFRSNGINFPVNVAVVPGNGGTRVSLMLGFNARHR